MTKPDQGWLAYKHQHAPRIAPVRNIVEAVVNAHLQHVAAAERNALVDALVDALYHSPPAAALRRLFGGPVRTRADRFAYVAGHGSRLGVLVDSAWALAGGDDVVTPPDYSDPTMEGL